MRRRILSIDGDVDPAHIELIKKRARVLGKGATVEQNQRLYELAPNSRVKVRHHRPDDVFLGLSPTGGWTSVIIIPEGDAQRDAQRDAVGIATCHQNDNYRKDLGVHIALARALKNLERNVAAEEGG